MKSYFLNVPNEERENILNQHKNVYDGYVTNYAKPNEQPLYVQDFANDKYGITVNNKGEVKRYTNIGINENMEGPELDYDVVEEDMFEEDETEISLEKNPSYDIDVKFTDELDNDDNERVKDNVQESLDWFKRFIKYK